MIWMVHVLERRAAKVLALALIVLFLGPLPTSSQDQTQQQTQEQGPKPFTPEELEQIVAPIAL